MQNCSLEDSQIEKERDVILRELQESDACLRDVVFDYLHATAFQGTPLAQPVEGPSDNVRWARRGLAGRVHMGLVSTGCLPVLLASLVHTTGSTSCVAVRPCASPVPCARCWNPGLNAGCFLP